MKKYVVRVLRKDGSLYNEEFYKHLNEEQAVNQFKMYILYFSQVGYKYELRRYFQNGKTGNKVIDSYQSLTY